MRVRPRRIAPRGRRPVAAVGVGLVAAVLVGVVLVAAVLPSCTVQVDRRVVEGEVEERTEAAFYRVPDPLPPGRPGELVRAERLLGAPTGARAWRILYHSRDVHGTDVAVSGVVLAPDGPGRDRPVVSWGHPTTGTAPRCAPSVGIDPFDTIEGARALVRAGFVVVATDYPGMGAAGPQSYLIGATEGRSVLDAARAARRVDGTGAGTRLLLWGHSQGGHAVLFAAREAAGYAPDLQLRALAAAAPAVELGVLLHDDQELPSGTTLGAYAFHAYDEVYGPTTPGLDLGQVLSPAGVVATPQLAALCLFGQHRALQHLAAPLVGNYVEHDPARVPPWSELLAANTPTTDPYGVPMLVAQGTADKVVDPSTTIGYVRGLCRAGQPVDLHLEPGVSHALVAVRAVDDVVSFFDDALAGRAVRSTC